MVSFNCQIASGMLREASENGRRLENLLRRLRRELINLAEPTKAERAARIAGRYERCVNYICNLYKNEVRNSAMHVIYDREDD